MSKIEQSILGYTRDCNKPQKTLQKPRESHEKERVVAMEVKIGGDPYLIVKFNEGKLKGETILFWGDRIEGGIVLTLSSGKIVIPNERQKPPMEAIRKLTAEEREYVKTNVLAHLEAGYENGTIKRTVTFAEQ